MGSGSGCVLQDEGEEKKNEEVEVIKDYYSVELISFDFLWGTIQLKNFDKPVC